MGDSSSFEFSLSSEFSSSMLLSLQSSFQKSMISAHNKQYSSEEKSSYLSCSQYSTIEENMSKIWKLSSSIISSKYQIVSCSSKKYSNEYTCSSNNDEPIC